MNTEILNKYIELINKGYCSDCNELNCIGNFPHKHIAKAIEFILKENQELKKKINTYENPEDLTLMFMYCDEKAKDKIKCLEQENQQLKQQLERSEKARKEAVELLKDSSLEVNTREYGNLTVVNSDDLLEILDIDKGE